MSENCVDLELVRFLANRAPYAAEFEELLTRDTTQRLHRRGQYCAGARLPQVLKERLATFYDNAVMESFFATVKSELADRFDLPQFLAEALRHE